MADWRITTVPTSVEFAASRCTESFRQGLASQYLNDQLHRALQDQSDRFNIWSGEVTANAKAFTAFNASIAEDENTAGLLIILLERLDRQVKALISADADETRSSLLGAGLEELSYDSNPSSESSISGLSDDEVQASWPRFQTDGLEIEAMSKTLNQLYRFITSTTKSLALEASARIDRFIKEQKAEHEVDELCLLTEWRMHQNLRTITQQFLRNRLIAAAKIRLRKLFYHQTCSKLNRKRKGPLVEYVQLPKSPRLIDTSVSILDESSQPRRVVDLSDAENENIFATDDFIFEWSRSAEDSESVASSRERMLRAKTPAELDIPVPNVSPGSTHIECPYCSELMETTEFSGTSWTRHLLQDVDPYVCLFDDCTSAQAQFSNEADWIEHMQFEHNSVWVCPVNGHVLRSVRSSASFEDHMKQHHRDLFTDSQLPSLVQKAVQPSSQLFDKPVFGTSLQKSCCPFCDFTVDDNAAGKDKQTTSNEIGNYSNTVQRHIAQHLETVALLSLPVSDQEGEERDVELFIEEELRAHDASHLLQTLIDMSDGKFLIAKMLIIRLFHTNSKALQGTIDLSPPLAALEFNRFYHIRWKTLSLSTRRLIEELFDLLICAKRQLYLQETSELLSALQHEEVSATSLLDVCPEVFSYEPKSGVIKFADSSVSEYLLLEKRQRYLSLSDNKYLEDVTLEDHITASCACLNVLLDEEENFCNAANYASQFWIDHVTQALTQSEDVDRISELKSLLGRFLTDAPKSFARWSQNSLREPHPLSVPNIRRLVTNPPSPIFALCKFYFALSPDKIDLKHNRCVNLNGSTPLLESIIAGAKDVVSKLLESDALLGAQGRERSTPLVTAVNQNFLEIVTMLLDAGADVDAIDHSQSCTALEAAVRWGAPEMVKLLVTRGAEINLQVLENLTPLQVAAGRGNEKIVSVLLDAGAKVNVVNSPNSFTALEMAVQESHTGVAELLIAHNAEVNFQADEHMSLLQVAAGNGDEKIISMLLEAGADINGDGNTNRPTPLEVSIEHGHKGIAIELIKKGASIIHPGTHDSFVLIQAAGLESKEVVECIVDSGMLNHEHSESLAEALQVAASEGRRSVVSVLLKAGADVTAFGGRWGTAVQAAASKDYEELFKRLFHAGADVTASVRRVSELRGVAEDPERFPLDMDTMIRKALGRFGAKTLNLRDLLAKNSKDNGLLTQAVYVRRTILMDTKAKFGPQGQETYRARLSLVEDLASLVAENTESYKGVEGQIVLDQILTEVKRDAPQDGPEALRLLKHISRIFLVLAEYKRAVRLFARYVEVLDRAQDEDELDSVIAICELAQCYAETRQMEESIALVRQFYGPIKCHLSQRESRLHMQVELIASQFQASGYNDEALKLYANLLNALTPEDDEYRGRCIEIIDSLNRMFEKLNKPDVAERLDEVGKTFRINDPNNETSVDMGEILKLVTEGVDMGTF